MNLSQKKCTISNLFLIFFFVSCSPSYPLNNREEAFINRYKDRRVIIAYDKRAIQDATSDGVYRAKISDEGGWIGSICSMDTTTIKLKARETASVLSKLMGHRENHRFIDVELETIATSLTKGDVGQLSRCNYTVRFLLTDLQQSKITHSSITYGPNPLMLSR